MHPVFVYYKDYKTSSNIYVKLLHLDTYRSIITFIINKYTEYMYKI